MFVCCMGFRGLDVRNVSGPLDKACFSSETHSKNSFGLQNLTDGKHVNIQTKLVLSDHELICQLLIFGFKKINK